MKWRNKSLSYWLRVLHRDLGYLMVGACLIYAVSGILLKHMNGKDPAFRTTAAAGWPICSAQWRKRSPFHCR